MRRHAKHRLIERALLALGLVLGQSSRAQTVLGTKHDLANGGSPVCVFCHTPHNANMAAAAPLWNRVLSTETFTMYTSPTLDSSIAAAPRPKSLICLSCHDGVSGTGNFGGTTLSTKHALVNPPNGGSSLNCNRCHNLHGPPLNWIGTNLGNDHPVSILYPSAAQDPEFNAPPDAQTGWGEDVLLLDQGYVECTTCHDVHDNTNAPFLRSSNAASAMCLRCHTK